MGDGSAEADNIVVSCCNECTQGASTRISSMVNDDDGGDSPSRSSQQELMQVY